jgi:hypothetical protein
MSGWSCCGQCPASGRRWTDGFRNSAAISAASDGLRYRSFSPQMIETGTRRWLRVPLLTRASCWSRASCSLAVQARTDATASGW